MSHEHEGLCTAQHPQEKPCCSNYDFWERWAVKGGEQWERPGSGQWGLKKAFVQGHGSPLPTWLCG